MSIHSPHLFAIYRRASASTRYSDLIFVGQVVAPSPIGPAFNDRFNERGYVLHYLGDLPDERDSKD